MKKFKLKTIIFFIAAMAVFALPVFASSTDGTIDSAYKYAWSENTGWINFGTANGNVHITDSGLSGSALSETVGWINLDNVSNDGAGNLSGYGWGENTGWIKFNPENGGVSINSSGEFSGSALGENTGWIIFDCDTSACVKTDWRPRSARPACNNAADDDGDNKIDYPADPGCSSLTDDDEADPSGGGLPAGAYSPPSAPTATAQAPSGFSVLINQGAEYTNSKAVELKLNGGPDAEKMAISNNADFKNAGQIPYKTAVSWNLCEGSINNPACDSDAQISNYKFQAYVKFYTKYGQPSPAVSDAIVLDTAAPKIQITEIKDYYSADEDVVIGGNTEAGAEIILNWDGKYGSTKADSNGKWTANLSKMPIADYQIKLQATDLAGNTGEFLLVDLIIKQAEISKAEVETAYDAEISREQAMIYPKEPGETKTIPERAKEVIKKIPDILEHLIPDILKPNQEKEDEAPAVPEKAPESMQGNYDLLSEAAIKKFILAPLPQSLESLAEKFPQLSRVFEKLGISKASDAEKLKNLKFTLPGLSEAAGLGGKRIAVSEFSKQEKEKIPEEIVFAKTAGELIDFNIDLTVDEQGRAEQRISIIAGKPLNLAIKPSSAAKTIKGYLALKNLEVGIQNLEHKDQNKARAISDKLKELVFANPVFAEEAPEPLKAEEKLVLIEFEYADPDKDGIWTAEINAPVVGGEYEIITIIEYEDPDLGARAIKLITVIDPEGYIYRVEKDGIKARIPNAQVSLFWMDPAANQYALWPADEYRQKNPQTTGDTGKYSFLVPEGNYYIKVEAREYVVYQGDVFEVKEGSGIHQNIELKKRFWRLDKVFDWKIIAIILLFALVAFNFYRDKTRHRKS